MDIEGNPPDNCKWDWLMVTDGDGTVLLDKMCGDLKPGLQTVSATNKINVIFHSDKMTNKKGFRAAWKQVGSKEEGLSWFKSGTKTMM